MLPLFQNEGGYHETLVHSLDYSLIGSDLLAMFGEEYPEYFILFSGLPHEHADDYKIKPQRSQRGLQRGICQRAYPF